MINVSPRFLPKMKNLKEFLNFKFKFYQFLEMVPPQIGSLEVREKDVQKSLRHFVSGDLPHLGKT